MKYISISLPSFLLSFSKDLDDKSKWTPGVVQTNTITVKHHMMFWGVKSGHRVRLNKECVWQTAAREMLLLSGAWRSILRSCNFGLKKLYVV